MNNITRIGLSLSKLLLLAGSLLATGAQAATLDVGSARWLAKSQRLEVKASGDLDAPFGRRINVVVTNADSDGAVFGSRARVEDNGNWQLEARRSLTVVVPCRVKVSAGGVSAERDVRNAPANCDGAGAGNTKPIAVAGGDQLVQLVAGESTVQVELDASASNDPDGSITAYLWSGSPDPDDIVSPLVTLPAGVHIFALQVTDNQGASSDPDSVTIRVIGDVTAQSINSTSQNAAEAILPVTEVPFVNSPDYAVLAANDLGMHCADLDYRVFSILPPFNTMHAQVVKKSGRFSRAKLMDDSEIEVVYSAVSNPNDPALSEAGLQPIYKSNFWADEDGDGRTLGYDTYAPLYFGLLQPGDVAALDTGLPVPDSVLLRGCLEDYLSGAEGPEGPRAKCGLAQQVMPGKTDPFVANQSVPFARFDRDINFFAELLGGLGLGGHITDTNWWSADGVPIKPVDDSGRRNSYPLMRVQARNKATGEVLASTDVVTPVASEADCQLCHAPAIDCSSVDSAQECKEHAITRTAFDVMSLDGDSLGLLPPGETDLERLINVAKINILRLHDAKHGTDLDASRPVQCSTCHYSPALDLAQLGPTDSPNTQQTQHITMSRAMHGHHGELKNDDGSLMFPDMPDPAGRDLEGARVVLEATCYACHPGKKTQCLRGAMSAGGVVCQDCHGEMRHVGNDFSESLAQNPWPDGANLSKRVPWAAEPGCQSCHTGDAVNNLTGTAGVAVAPDGIRLLQAYSIQPGVDTEGLADGSELAVAHVASNKRFAESESLYRISKGHGGVMCEGCHGSTHAIYPNPLDNANDNLAAKQLQGHAGTIVECDTCHKPGSLRLGLNGPHGMHVVNDPRWNREHEDFAERNPAKCRSCHGKSGQGTVLSRTAVERELICKDAKGSLCSFEDEVIRVAAKTQIGCKQCHENEIGSDD